MLTLYLTRCLEWKGFHFFTLRLRDQVQGVTRLGSNNIGTTFVLHFCLGEQIVTECLPSETQSTKVLTFSGISIKTHALIQTSLIIMILICLKYPIIQSNLVRCFDPKPPGLWEINQTIISNLKHTVSAQPQSFGKISSRKSFLIRKNTYQRSCDLNLQLHFLHFITMLIWS